MNNLEIFTLESFSLQTGDAIAQVLGTKKMNLCKRISYGCTSSKMFGTFSAKAIVVKHCARKDNILQLQFDILEVEFEKIKKENQARI